MRRDLTGNKYGKLLVIKPTQLVLNRIRKEKYEEWFQEYECLCDCGNVKLTTCQQLKETLKGKGTSSCGCAYRKEKNSKWSVPFNMVWKTYVCAANVRNRNFDLTKEEFFKLTSANCYYCDDAPQTICLAKNKRKDVYVYNGIDRVNNDLGYINRNCVTCCETCNRMKLQMTHENFLLHIKKIFTNRVKTLQDVLN